MAQNDLLYLDRAVGAWNVDGSSDALAESGSWLRDAEEATGRKRGRCSFEGCLKQAEVGGHMWITGMGCFIAPICRSCNRHDNQDRMQGAGARLRENIVVTRTEMTNGMHTATRRIAGGRRRRCQSCGDDISDRPANHASCLECWSGDAGDRRGGGADADDGASPAMTIFRTSLRVTLGVVNVGQEVGAREGEFVKIVTPTLPVLQAIMFSAKIASALR